MHSTKPKSHEKYNINMDLQPPVTLRSCQEISTHYSKLFVNDIFTICEDMIIC